MLVCYGPFMRDSSVHLSTNMSSMLPCTSTALYTCCLCHHAHYCVNIYILFSICTKYITIVMTLLYGAYKYYSCLYHVRDHTPLAEIKCRNPVGDHLRI